MSVLILLLTSVISGVAAKLPATCSSPVYCQGQLLHTVQMAQIFNDSRTFVNLKMRYGEDIIQKNFREMMHMNDGAPNTTQIKEFVDSNFEDADELEEWSPPDFKPDPKFLKTIRDKELRIFTKKVISMWKTLARRVKQNVTDEPHLYSLIPLPNGFILPGGRFKEAHYWDTYWIVRGLLISDMVHTARGIIENLLYLVQNFGFVPSGSRVYYTRRSQPPLLTKMVGQYIEKTNDLVWLDKNIHIMEDEIKYWMRTHLVQVKIGRNFYQVYRYDAPTSGPRPEFYYEDTMTAQSTENPQKMYVELKSAAESGWEFSSRWIVDDNGENKANFTYLHTRRIVPVDLNAYMYEAFATLAQLHRRLNRPKRALIWRRRAASLEIAITAVLWNEEVGVWLDYDTELGRHRKYFYPSNLTPLWVKCCVNRNNNGVHAKIIAYLKDEAIQGYLGGTPTSLVNTGELWDLPNAWPPLQAIMVQALRNTGYEEAVTLAKTLAQRWVNVNVRGYKDQRALYDRYDAQMPGKYPFGTDHAFRDGYGWTNGVVLEFINMYENISVKYER